MRSGLLILAFLAGLVLASPAAHTQSPKLQDAAQRAQSLYSEGRYDEAVRVAQTAVRLSEQEFGPEHLNTGAVLVILGSIYHAQGHFAEAEPLFKRSLAIGEKALGPEHPGLATTLTFLAAVYRGQGRVAEAEPLYERALAK